MIQMLLWTTAIANECKISRVVMNIDTIYRSNF